MYSRICIPLLILLAFLFNSCKKDFLDVKDNSFLNRQSYVRDISTLGHFFNGIYVMLSSRLLEEGVGAAYPELVADNLKPLPLAPSPGSGTQSLVAHYSWAQIPDETRNFRVRERDLNMNAYWLGGYHIIRACNFVIESAAQYRNENPTRADDMKGQALAIRALVHLKLATVFSQHYLYTADASHPSIPYITVSDIAEPFTRQTAAVVYAHLVDDLKEAISLLPDSYSDVGHMNRKAAKALLARVYLYQDDLINAKNLSLEVVGQAPLMAISAGYPNQLFYKGIPGSEVLFQLPPINLSGSNEVSRFIGMNLRGSALRYLPTADIVNMLLENANDIRSSWVSSVTGTNNVSKFPIGVAVENPAISIPETSYYPAVIRSSELYLTIAEASVRTGDENTARTYLDAIRQRADPSIANVVASGSALLDSVYKERRKELCFEGFRMPDLQRWKQPVQRGDIHEAYGDVHTLAYPSDKAIAPIPLQEITLAGLTQNASY